MHERMCNITLGVRKKNEHDSLRTDSYYCLPLCTTKEKEISICYLTCVDGKSRTGT